MTNDTITHVRPRQAPSTLATWLLFATIYLAVYFASLFTPPLMDDVDASHAQAAQHIAETGNWITCKINGIRYIEKPPLPYWLVAVSYRFFGQNTFATHLPNALAMLGLTWLAWVWAKRAWGARAGLYAGLGILTSIGPFLFTRFIIPEAILSLFLLISLYGLITGLESCRPARIYMMWAALALALLTKGLIAPVFFVGAAVPYLLLTGQWRRWRELKPVTGVLTFLAIAAPWHILVGLANPDQGHAVGNHPTIGNVHGFWYFYLVNEHYLRFFGLRYPHDYNKMPFAWYWLAHLVWLFPWSLFLPAVVAVAWKTRRHWLQHMRHDAGTTVDFYLDNAAREDVASYVARLKFRVRSTWLLSLFTAWTLFFFSLSTNQEYYTFPVWPPLFILIAAVAAGIEEKRGLDGSVDTEPQSARLLLSTALPDDRHNYTREYLETRLAMLYGGRVAEEIFLNQMSTGAGNDIERATELARAMVCEYGMSRLGPLTFGKKEEQIFLGREIAQHRDFSEETARQIDLEVRRLIDEAYQAAHNLVETNADAMHRIAAALLERETIDAEELKLLLEGKTLPALRSSLAGGGDSDGTPQQVLKPEGRGTGTGGGLPEGSPSPA